MDWNAFFEMCLLEAVYLCFIYNILLQMAHTMNTKDFSTPKRMSFPLFSPCLLFSLTLTLVLFLMSRKYYLRSSSNLLLCSLALSDLLTGLVSVPLFITCNIVRQSAICIMEEQMSRFISASIVCHLMSVTADRLG